jgi:hypothetical protein
MTGEFSSYFKGKPVPKVVEKKPDQGSVNPMDALRNLPGAQSAGTPPPRRTPPPRKPAPKKPEQPKKEPEKKEPAPGEKPAEPEKKQPESPNQPPEPGKQPDKPAPAPKEEPENEGGASGINEIDIPGGGVVEEPKPDSEPAEPAAPKDQPKTETPKPGVPEKAGAPETEKPKTEQPRVPGGPPALPPPPPGAGEPDQGKPKGVKQGLPSGIPIGPAPPSLGNAAAPKEKTVEQSEWTQVVVIGDVDFLLGVPGRGPHIAPPPGPPHPGYDYSWRLVRNTLEWMRDEEDIVRIRGRGLRAQNLESDISPGAQMAARIFAIGTIPVLMIFVALGLWGMKRRRRRRDKDNGGE